MYMFLTGQAMIPAVRSVRPCTSSTSFTRSLTHFYRTMGTTTAVKFGPFEVTTQVFLTTPHSFALVNLKPLLPGHVLVCPHKPYKRLTDMSPPELTDIFQTVQKVQHMLARHYFNTPTQNGKITRSSLSSSSSSSSLSLSSGESIPSPADGSFNIAIQDGSDAGQTVPHLHVHVIPRIPGETAKDGSTIGDAIYEDMAGEKGNVGGALWDRANDGGVANGRPVPGGAFARIEDVDRAARSMEDMEAEAAIFRGVLEQMEKEEKR